MAKTDHRLKDITITTEFDTSVPDIQIDKASLVVTFYVRRHYKGSKTVLLNFSASTQTELQKWKEEKITDKQIFHLVLPLIADRYYRLFVSQKSQFDF